MTDYMTVVGGRLSLNQRFESQPVSVSLVRLIVYIFQCRERGNLLIRVHCEAITHYLDEDLVLISDFLMFLSIFDLLPGCLFAVVVIKCFTIRMNV